MDAIELQQRLSAQLLADETDDEGPFIASPEAKRAMLALAEQIARDVVNGGYAAWATCDGGIYFCLQPGPVGQRPRRVSWSFAACGVLVEVFAIGPSGNVRRIPLDKVECIGHACLARWARDGGDLPLGGA